ncbi:MAG: sensor histidine kinase [Pseudomonadota bacterium]
MAAISPDGAWADAASSNVVLIETDSPNGPIDRYVTYFLEPGGELSLDEVTAPSNSDNFKPIETSAADFGYYTKGIWLRISVRNLSASAQERLLILHTNFMPEIDVYWVSNDAAQTLIRQNRNTKFGERPIAYHQIVAPITIKAAQTGAIYIRYTSEGNTVLPVSLETAVSFARTTNNRVTIDFAFYGVMMMFVCASIIGRFFWKNPTFIAYSLYAASVLLYIFQRDGYAFQYLWPNAPEWNTFSSLPIGGLLPIFAAIFTRAYLNTKNLHPIIDKILIAVVVMQLAVIFSFVAIGASSAKKIAVMTTTLSIITFFSIGIAAYRKYGRRTLFFVIGWLGILCASMVMTVTHWANIDISRAQSLDVMRIAMVFDALMMGLASVFSIVEIQRDREKLDQERIAVLNANLDLHNRFGRLEQKYHLAQTLAETNSQLLVDTTHDLRQPLYALRAAMGDALSEKAPPPERVAEIKQSLNYIEELVEATLEKAIEEEEARKGAPPDKQEIMSVSKLFSALETMFAKDAFENGIDLKAMPTATAIRAIPFPILRIMTNFVSNAIRHSKNGRILIGVRRRGESLSLEVHDTGAGMSPDQLAKAKERYARGDAPGENDNGKGVGLSIVSKLADKHDLEWSLDSRECVGTIARVIVPAASPDPAEKSKHDVERAPQMQASQLH